ncbi:hypothetical protein EMWEY_00054630, partial [Eimeria maxima]
MFWYTMSYLELVELGCSHCFKRPFFQCSYLSLIQKMKPVFYQEEESFTPVGFEKT